MRTILLLLLLVGLGVLGWAIRRELLERDSTQPTPASRGPVPVEVASIERATLRLRRTFGGALEAAEEILVAPKVAGRIEELAVDLGDEVSPGQVVARLDDAEFVQALAQARAELAVAEANRAEAESALAIAARALSRFEALGQQGVVSESEFDVASAGEMAGRARLEVTQAQVARAEAAVETARIRLGYATVIATLAVDGEWGSGRRVVAERFVDVGATVAANDPLFTVVELDPVVAVLFVPERDYARLAVGLEARIVTDAYPGESFAGSIARIAPVFRRSTRQVRVELAIPNNDERLKPGMFVRATLDLGLVEHATVVPVRALTEREEQVGVFVLGRDETHVTWCPVETGVVEGDRVEVIGAPPSGRVVILGQDLCDDGSEVRTVDTSNGSVEPSSVERAVVADE